MIVTFEGRDWQADPSRLRLQQGYVIQAFTGMSVGDWQDSLDFRTDQDGKLVNPPPEWLRSVAALYWLMCDQNGVQQPIADVDFEVEPFLAAYLQGLAAELERVRAEKAARPDPTSPPQSPGGPPLPAPSTPTVTTPPLPVPALPGTASWQPATYADSVIPTSSSLPVSVT